MIDLLHRARAGLGAVALAAVFGLMAGAAQAGPERLPLTGDPAIVIDAPTGWEVSRDDVGNLYLKPADRSTVLVLNVASGVGGATLDTLAAEALKVANAQPYAASETGTVGEVAGRTYHTTMPSNDNTGEVTMTLARLDADHIVSQSTIWLAGTPPAQRAAVLGLLPRIHIVGRAK